MTTTITLFGGVQKTLPKNNLPCGLESSYPKTQIYLEITEPQYHTKHWNEIKNQYSMTVSKDSPDFWRTRIIIHLAASSFFHSATFIPFDFKTVQTWFMQKGEVKVPMNEVFAPFLIESDQTHIIENVQDIQLTIQNLENELHWEAFILLSYFYLDPLTRGMSLTYTLKDGSLGTSCWTKAMVV